MTDTERLDAIIKEVQHKLGYGWWHHAMCEVHRGSFLGHRHDPRDIIDAAFQFRTNPPHERGGS